MLPTDTYELPGYLLPAVARAGTGTGAGAAGWVVGWGVSASHCVGLSPGENGLQIPNMCNFIYALTAIISPSFTELC